MKTSNFFFTLLIVACASISCNNTPKQADSVEAAEDINEEQVEMKEDNSDFLVKAASGGMMEVALGKMAQQNAQSQRVKNFGAMMVKDHTTASDEIKTLAVKKNITLPAIMGEENQKHVDEMKEKSGAEFDKMYMELMVEDHNEDIRLFESASDDENDSDVQAFSKNTLIVLQMHLDSARAINEAVKE